MPRVGVKEPDPKDLDDSRNGLTLVDYKLRN